MEVDAVEEYKTLVTSPKLHVIPDQPLQGSSPVQVLGDQWFEAIPFLNYNNALASRFDDVEYDRLDDAPIHFSNSLISDDP